MLMTYNLECTITSHSNEKGFIDNFNHNLLLLYINHTIIGFILFHLYPVFLTCLSNSEQNTGFEKIGLEIFTVQGVKETCLFLRNKYPSLSRWTG
jgi:hypothetical protein